MKVNLLHEECIDANGFSYALLVWACEAIPLVGKKYGGLKPEEGSTIPFILRWNPTITSSFDKLTENIFMDVRLADHSEIQIEARTRLDSKLNLVQEFGGLAGGEWRIASGNGQKRIKRSIYKPFRFSRRGFFQSAEFNRNLVSYAD